MIKINPTETFENFIDKNPTLKQNLTETNKKELKRLYQDAKDWANIVETTTDLMYHHNDAGIDYTNDYNRNLDRKIAADRRLEDALLTLTSGLEIQATEEIPSMQK